MRWSVSGIIVNGWFMDFLLVVFIGGMLAVCLELLAQAQIITRVLKKPLPKSVEIDLHARPLR